ncbi:hypothetical protein [Vagococcus humatus]|uniref:Membrane protein NfeD2 N-terminal transmembrane domain-containing protein n=1 Tax=Vagococcus humatus TaxID=1889241 RepID=A0A3R9YG06_9ENTE|nr:hypothetical protein [Vagococcus humatus]RST90274.1 hypothetical protein C7P63_04150 [Vagococcus humatus]
MIGNLSYETVYLYLLIACVGMSVVLLMIGDIFQMDGPVDPMLLVPWLGIIALIGYIGERYNLIHSGLLLGIAIGISTVLVFLLNFYVVVPLKKTESTLSSSEKDLEGQKALVITPIPIKGMGEIQVKSVTGSITRPASLYVMPDKERVAIKKGESVLIIEIHDRVCYVVPYQENFN